MRRVLSRHRSKKASWHFDGSGNITNGKWISDFGPQGDEGAKAVGGDNKFIDVRNGNIAPHTTKADFEAAQITPPFANNFVDILEPFKWR